MNIFGFFFFPFYLNLKMKTNVAIELYNVFELYVLFKHRKKG